jgi:MYXO-CTERM domain-containing protein
MKITRKILASLVFALAAHASFAAVDSYLYWMVDDAKNQYNDSPISFNYATVSIDGTYLNLYDGTTDLDSYKAGVDPVFGDYSTGSYYAGYDSSVPFSTFLVELWINDDTRVGWKTYSLSELGSYIAGGMNQVGSPLVVSQVVPEPTSGLLSLFGLAALALRRRRRA